MNRVEVRARHPAEMKPVPIVSDAIVMSRGVADGRMIPVLILDTSERQDIDDMIRAHEHYAPGDVTSIWVKPPRFGTGGLRLVLKVIKPGECLIVLEFDVLHQGGVVDQIMQSQGLYLQAGRPGDRLSSTFEHPRIIIEVPSSHFRADWDRILRKALFKDYRRGGLSRGEAKASTDRFLAEWRDLTSKRMKSEYDQGTSGSS